MSLSRKCQYGLRALFELARSQGKGPVPSHQIAEAQAIPPNFLELILKELRQAGWIDSFRGPSGGYVLAVKAAELSVGKVIRFVEGPLTPTKCMGGVAGRHCAREARCAFAGLWDRAENRLSDLYDNTTFQDLVDEQNASVNPGESSQFN